MGLFKKKPKTEPVDVEALHAAFAAAFHEALESVRQRLDASEQSREALEARVLILNETASVLTNRAGDLDELTRRLAEVDSLKGSVAELGAAQAKLVSFDGLNPRLTELAAQVTTSSLEAKTANERAASLNQRVSNLSTEFANQLSELSREIDQLSTAGLGHQSLPEQMVTEDMIEELHEGQVRLANEQARYEIAFRQDLAMLAEQVKRARSA